MLEFEILKVTKCIRVNSFVETLINMVCNLKITSGSKFFLWKFHVIQHFVEELLAKMLISADEMHSRQLICFSKACL